MPEKPLTSVSTGPAGGFGRPRTQKYERGERKQAVSQRICISTEKSIN
jgi:hypothetical protein